VDDPAQALIFTVFSDAHRVWSGQPVLIGCICHHRWH